MTPDEPIEVSILRQDRRSIALQPKSGLLVVKAPLRMPEDEIYAFVAKHREWIKIHCAPKVLSFELAGSPIDWDQPFHEGIAIPVDVAVEARSKVHKQLCHALVTSCYHETCERLGIAPSPLRICSMSSAWGKCHSTARIELHWQVGRLPKTLIDYIICHELSHLAHFDHSPSFWAFADNLHPHARRSDRLLKDWTILK